MGRFGFGRWAEKRAQANLNTSREAFRVLRSNLDVAIAGLDKPCIVITSATEGEGKTSTAVALAESFAASGSNVVLVDLDLRHPDAHRLLGGRNDAGVSDVLVGRLHIGDCLQRVDLQPFGGLPATGMYFVSAGSPVANPTELLSEERLTRMLDGLASAADIVFLDAPPVLAVADALDIGRLSAGAVLVVRAGATPAPVVRRAKEALARSNVRLLGVVLNQFDTRFAGEDYEVGLGYGPAPTVAPSAARDRLPAGRGRRLIGPALAALVVVGTLAVGISVAARADDKPAPPVSLRPVTSTTSQATTTTSTPVARVPGTVARDGHGTATVPIARPDGAGRATVVYATHQGHAFRLTAGRTVLVDATGPYQGYTLLPAGSETKLSVRADGPWHLEFRSVRRAKQWDGAAQLGRGDQVLLYDGPATGIELRYDGQGGFLVRSTPAHGGSPEQLARSLGPSRATARITAGPLLLTVQANNAVWGVTATA